nr:hypothetical protein [Tanacetum cinerariifolium]
QSEAIIRRDLHLDDADGVECLPNAEIFEELAIMGYEKPPPKLTFYKAFIFAERKVRKGISGVETPLFDFMLVQSQQQAEAGVKVPITHAQPSTTSAPSPTKLQDTTPTPHDTPPQYQPLTPHDSPLQDQLTTPHDSPMPLLTTLMETCATLSQKVATLEKDRNSQALEILQVKKRVKRLERKKKSNTLGLKRLRRFGADQKRRTNLKTKVHLVKENVNAASKGFSVITPKLVSIAEPIVFDDEDVTMKMAQTLIKLKAARILNEKIAQKLHDEEV